MKVFQTNEVKNIALVGGAGSGKTTLAETMLFDGKIISRRGSIADKNTVSDYREIELEKGQSVASTLMYTIHNGKKINIIDTPGTPDYVGEVTSALHVADTAFLLVDAHQGVNVGTEIAWRNTTRYNSPVTFVINQLDHEKSNYADTMNQMRESFGDKVTLVQYPLGEGADFHSIIDLVLMKMLKYGPEGGDPEILDIPAAEMAKAEELKMKLIENAAEGSEELMEKYFADDTLSIDDLRLGIRLGLANRAFYPVFCISALKNVGISRLMEFINLATPTPDARHRITTEGKELTSNPQDPASIFIFKTSIEPHLGEVSYFRVYGGCVTEGTDLVNSRNGNKERMSQILITAGKNREKVERILAGDIGAAIKLKDTQTNDTLNDIKVKDLALEKIQFPDPVFFTAAKAAESSDDEKLGLILNDTHRVDPSFKIQYSKELKQMILSGMGETHINNIRWHLEKIHKIAIEFMPTRIPYRETITKSAKADYRHKKQSGGAGQFGEVHLLIQPYFEGYKNPTEFPVRGTETHELPWGGKLVYNNCIVGGSIDARFMPAILKGIMERIETGPLTGSYARDIVVYVYDGKMHPVDSNELSFRLAGRNAFATAFKNAGPKIMEPIYNMEIRMPEDMMGGVMTDLQGRRGIIMGMDSDGRAQIIRAKVPLAELNRYSTSLSSITSGRGTFSMTFDAYQQVPAEVQTALLKKYEEEQDDE
jgi:elongation factor G